MPINGTSLFSFLNHHRHHAKSPDRAALKFHPDRVPVTSPDRASRTRKFQQINDAYYTLSDRRRRRDYDRSRREANPSPPPPPPPHDNADGTSSFTAEQFGSIFEEMLREEGMGTGDEGAAAAAEGQNEEEQHGGGGGGRFWSLVGGLSGAGLGFIVANVPGALAGAVAGNRLGAVRDRQGKSVYEAFQELPQEDRAKVLSRLAARVLQSAVS